MALCREFAPEGRLLPMPSNDTLNRHLKELAAVCSIDREISFHKAHHNFGTHITLSQGVPIETVSRMMGHKNISTTQIYAKVTDKKVDEDMKRLAQRTAGTKTALYEDEKLRAAIRYPGRPKRETTGNIIQTGNNQ